MTAPKNLPGVGEGKSRRRAVKPPARPALFWGLWLAGMTAVAAADLLQLIP